MNIRPKTYVAVVDFSCAGMRFRAGDVVPRSAALAAAMRHGDRFVIPANRSNRAPQPNPADEADDIS